MSNRQQTRGLRALMGLAIVSLMIALSLGALELATRLFFDSNGMHYGIEMWKYAKTLKRASENWNMGHEHVLAQVRRGWDFDGHEGQRRQGDQRRDGQRREQTRSWQFHSGLTPLATGSREGEQLAADEVPDCCEPDADQASDHVLRALPHARPLDQQV